MMMSGPYYDEYISTGIFQSYFIFILHVPYLKYAGDKMPVKGEIIITRGVQVLEGSYVKSASSHSSFLGESTVIISA